MNRTTAPHRVAEPLDLLQSIHPTARLGLLAAVLLLFLVALYLGVYSVPETAATPAFPSTLA